METIFNKTPFEAKWEALSGWAGSAGRALTTHEGLIGGSSPSPGALEAYLLAALTTEIHMLPTMAAVLRKRSISSLRQSLT